MSYEGTYQCLCKNGHQSFVDVYSHEKECCFCHTPFVWRQSIDETNGEGSKKELKLLKDNLMEKCTHCGHEKLIEPAVYEIPKDEGFHL